MRAQIFHRFSNLQRNINSIWELKDDKGTRVLGFKDIVHVGIQHFDNIYKEPKGANFMDIVKV
jgi:hypothetical protein